MILKSTSNGVALTQKTDSKLCLTTPAINIEERYLEDSFPYMLPIKVALNPAEKDVYLYLYMCSALCQSKVYGAQINGINCGDDEANWFV